MVKMRDHDRKEDISSAEVEQVELSETQSEDNQLVVEQAEVVAPVGAENEEVVEESITDVPPAVDSEKNSSFKSSKGGKNFIKILAGLVVCSSAVGGIGFYVLSGDSLVNMVSFSNTEKSYVPSREELNKMNLEVDTLRQEVTDLTLKVQTVDKMKQKNDILEQRVTNLQSYVEGEIARFETLSEQRHERSEAISKRMAELKVSESITDTNRAEIATLRSEVEELHLESAKAEDDMYAKLKHFESMLELANKKEVKVQKSSTPISKKTGMTVSVQTQTKEIEYITQLGPLRLSGINSFGSQYVADLTDTVSGAFAVIEGDRVGQYRIETITDDYVLFVNQSGKHIALIEG
jgi:hypothetical protein